MGTCLKESIRKLQHELNKEIEKSLNEEKYISSQSVMKISQKLDLLIVRELKNKLKASSNLQKPPLKNERWLLK